MSGLVVAQQDLAALICSPLTWGIALGAIGLWIIFADNGPRLRRIGKLIAALGLVVAAMALPTLSRLSGWQPWLDQIVFWMLAGVAIGCSGASVTARNPVYTAIWFAGSLLGVAGLFLFQSAEFLGVATIVVYAGAIVVTFLFVLMLASPAGHARYDRVSWSNVAVPLSLVAGAGILLFIAHAMASPPTAAKQVTSKLLAEDHMAQLGTELFARHLVAVEVAGTLLLVALVGAVAIISQGKARPSVPQGNGQAGRTGGLSL